MTELEKRMKRAARFGIDPSKLLGPQASLIKTQENDQECLNKQDTEMAMDIDTAFEQIAVGSGAKKIERVQTQIERIRARQERFEDE